MTQILTRAVTPMNETTHYKTPEMDSEDGEECYAYIGLLAETE